MDSDDPEVALGVRASRAMFQVALFPFGSFFWGFIGRGLFLFLFLGWRLRYAVDCPLPFPLSPSPLPPFLSSKGMQAGSAP